MKLVIIIVLVLAIAGGGGYAGWKVLMKDTPDVAATEEPHEEEPQDPSTIAFVEMAPIYVSVIGKDPRDNKIMTFVVVLEVPDPKNESYVVNMRPRLHDRFLDYLNALSGVDHGRHLKNTAQIKHKFLRIAKEELGDEIVDSILITLSLKRNAT